MLTPAGRVAADIGVRGEQIAQIGGVMTGAREISAKGRLVLPGGFDPHVHLTTPRENEHDLVVWADNLQSGSEAAFAGGITSVGNMSFVMPNELPSERLEKEVAELQSTGMADMVFHPVVLTPNEANIANVVTQIEMGVSSVKFFMSFPTFDSLAKQYGLLMCAASDAGALTMIHCEDAATIECCNGMLKKHGHNSLRHFAESRPIPAEAIATDRAIAMCEATGAPTYIVHLSSKKALDSCTAARKRGLPIYVETRPLYLHMTSDRYHTTDGPLFVAQPPLRNTEDVESLWRGLADGTIDTMGSDHAPWTRAEKMNPELNLDNLRPGVSDLETMLPMLFSEGVLKDRITLERFVQLTSETPAKLFGLYPRKGAIAVGSDADLAIWETGGTKVVRGARMYSRAGHSVYEGTELNAWPSLVVRRGQVVFENEVVVAKPGSGKWLLAPR